MSRLHMPYRTPTGAQFVLCEDFMLWKTLLKVETPHVKGEVTVYVHGQAAKMNI